MTTDPYLLGDPHLGRRFTKGVPVERRGEREQLVRADFIRQLNPAGAAVHITMGDLFDKPQVPYADVQFAYRAYREAARRCPGTVFYILQGNHDDSRDLAEVTAWDLFCDNVAEVPNIVAVTEPLISDHIALFPWHPTKPAAEAVERCWSLPFRPPVAYGHWDVDPRTQGLNLIPTAELAALGVTRAYTGHVHKPDAFRRDGVEVTVVGSMQPYAQGEDGGQGHIRYVTLGLVDLDGIRDLSDCCVRLQLQPGEQYDGEIPACQSWDVQRLRPADEEAPADVSMEGFDTAAVARAALDDHDIIPEVRERIDARWSEVFGREHA